MPLYRKIRGDGNCFYRAVIIIYLDLLFFNDDCSYNDLTKKKIRDSKIYAFLKKTKEIKFLDFEDNDNRREFTEIFKEIDKMRNLILINISKLFLRKLLLQKENKELWFKEWQKYFINSINTNPEFDIALVLLLRSMIFDNLRTNNEKFKDFIIDIEGIKKILQTYGLEAEDMIVPLSSIAMEVKIFKLNIKN